MRSTPYSLLGMLLAGILAASASRPALAGPEPLEGEPAAEAGRELTVLLAAETPTGVTLHVDARRIAPDSVRVLLAGNQLVVVAKDREGRPIRSRPIHLESPLTEEGAEADWLGNGWLALSLRKAEAPPMPKP